MTRKELEQQRFRWVHENVVYKMCLWNKWNYDVLDNIMYSRRSGRGTNDSWSDAIIMADTETSKKKDSEENHVVAFTISIRAFDMNIVTLYGHDPEEFCKCLKRIRKHIQGDHFIVYWHNMPYDWVFIRKFMFKYFGHPEKQLNIKPHYPLFINFDSGIQFRDSLILAQRSLEKWADDLQVEHKKAVGLWDYDKIRNQHERFSGSELEYIEHDTLAGVECINKLMDALGKKLWSMPYTATGIPREEVRRRGKKNGAKQLFDLISLTLAQYKKMENVFHGGFTHANRHLINELIEGLIQCFDFASSYPFVLITRKYPMDKFKSMDNVKLQRIIDSAEDTAFMFKLILYKPQLKNDFIPMPVLQVSKCVKSVNVITDNGRILSADYVEIWCNEIDVQIIDQQYKRDGDICVEVEYAHKDYLPRWFTDYIFELFAEKCKLKEGDPVLYALAKARLNSLYGLCVQKSIKPQIDELYADKEVNGEIKKEGEYIIDEVKKDEELYEKYLENKGNILSFAWGTWCTSYAMYNLFCLGSCVKDDPKQMISHWIYSDTDSCYSDLWDYEKIERYNEKCKEELRANGYGPVIVDGKEYWLGIAEHKEGEDDYSQFKTEGAKRYCGRQVKDGKLHITVAGVPKKKGAECLNDDIEKFTEGFIFPGSETGKLTHKYFYVPAIYTDKDGNITGDSIDLSPCDYLLDSTEVITDWFHSLDKEINYQVYDEGRIY